MKPTLQCYKCKQQFPRNELVEYTGWRAQNAQKYCPACLEEKKSNDAFEEYVCKLFNIKAPGSRINGDKKRLTEKYGYTNKTIMDTLDYIYNVKGLKVLSKSLALVKPSMVEEMLKYKRAKEIKSNILTNAFINGMQERSPERIHARENEENKKAWNVDDYFFDD